MLFCLFLLVDLCKFSLSVKSDVDGLSLSQRRPLYWQVKQDKVRDQTVRISALHINDFIFCHEIRFGSQKFVKMHLQQGLLLKLCRPLAKSFDLSIYSLHSTVILYDPVIIDSLSIAYPMWCDRFFNHLSFSDGKPWIQISFYNLHSAIVLADIIRSSRQKCWLRVMVHRFYRPIFSGILAMPTEVGELCRSSDISVKGMSDDQ